MSNINYQLSRRDQLLIESYKEQTAAWRHENNLLYRFTTITLPVSIGALGVPYVQKGVPDLLAVLGGLTLMTFWAFSCQIMQIKSNLRFSVINEIEACWHILSHKDCKVRKQNTYGKKGSDRFRSHFLRCCIYWVYLVIVGALTLYRTIHCMWSAQWECETVIISIAEIIVTFTLVSVSGVFVAKAMHKAGEEVCMKDKHNTNSPDNDTGGEQGISTP